MHLYITRLRSNFTRFLESHLRRYSIFPQYCLQQRGTTDMMVRLSPSVLSKCGPTEWPRCWQIVVRAEENHETLNMVGIQTFWIQIQRCSNDNMAYVVWTFVPVPAFLVLGKQVPCLNLRVYVQTFSEWIFVTCRLFFFKKKWQHFSSSAPKFPKQHFFLDFAQQLVWT